MAIAAASAAQDKTETFKVLGNCGMCKSKIEKSAKAAGASFAAWDVDSKILTVKYNSTSTNTAKIQKQIASVGYDNEGATATKAAYDKLHSCCKYDRDASLAKSCSEECKKACEEKGCCKEGAVCEKDCCKSDMQKEGCCSGEAKCEKSCCSKEGK